jgi:hypothetical protein
MASIDPVRIQALDEAVAHWARNGWSVSSVSGATAVLQRKKRIGWFWNLVLTLLTGGLWLIVVVIRVVNRKIQTVVLTVDEYARVHTS